jgi:hypothetical protein
VPKSGGLGKTAHSPGFQKRRQQPFGQSGGRFRWERDIPEHYSHSPSIDSVRARSLPGGPTRRQQQMHRGVERSKERLGQIQPARLQDKILDETSAIRVDAVRSRNRGTADTRSIQNPSAGGHRSVSINASFDEAPKVLECASSREKATGTYNGNGLLQCAADTSNLGCKLGCQNSRFTVAQ